MRKGTPLWACLSLTPLVPWLGVVPHLAILLPLAAPLPLWPMFRRLVREGRTGSAFAAAMLWAALLSTGVVLLVHFAPALAARAILNGESYAAEMLQWIRTGVGDEVTPAHFLPQHALHLALFLILAWASGGYLGLVLGSYLVGYMSYFVGCFATASGEPFVGALVAWVPWSVIRVLSFVLLGTLAARPLLERAWWPFTRVDGRLALLGVLGLALDLATKIGFARPYGWFLRSWLPG